MFWKQAIQKVVTHAKQAIKQIRERNHAKQAPEPKQQTVEKKSQPLKENKATKLERAKADADKMTSNLKEQGIGQKGQEVQAHDGSIPQGGNGTSSSGSYNPPREPRSSYRGKTQEKGREL